MPSSPLDPATRSPLSTLSRRSFVALSLGVAASAGLMPRRALASPRLLAADPRFFEWSLVRESKPNVHAAMGQGGNSMVVVGKDACILVDAKNAPYGAQLRREAEAIGGRLAHLINTHHHGDHTGGNHAFVKPSIGRSEGAPLAVDVVAHEKTKARVEAQVGQFIGQLKSGSSELAELRTAKAGDAAFGALITTVAKDADNVFKAAADLKASDFAPTTTFTDSKELDVGGVRVVLRYFGAAHTDNDIIVHLPDLNIIHTGDLLFRKVYPYIDGKGGGSTKPWQATLREIAKLCDAQTRIVPGHGMLCDKAALDEQIKYFDDMRAFVGEQIKQGKSREEVTKMNPAPYDSYNVEWIRPITLGGIYDEVKAGA